MEDVELPSKVDVIVSEWMGYFLLYENMLEAVLAAKGRFLEEGGSIFPTVVELYVAPFTDAAMHGERRRFWSDVSGVDMSALLPEVLVEFAAEPRIEGLDFEQLVGEPILLWRHDFRGPAPAASPLRIQARASWFCPPGATAHGYAGWFDCHFDASAPAPPCERASAAEGAALAELLASAFHARFERGAAEPGEPAASKRRRSGQPPPGRPGARQASVLSTAPGAARTHWHHTLFFFREPVPPGSAVEAEFARVSGTSGAKGWVWALRVEHQLGAPAGARSGRPRSGSCAPTRARACAPRPCPPRAPGSTTSGGDRSFGRCSARPLLRRRAAGAFVAAEIARRAARLRRQRRLRRPPSRWLRPGPRWLPRRQCEWSGGAAGRGLACLAEQDVRAAARAGAGAGGGAVPLPPAPRRSGPWAMGSAAWPVLAEATLAFGSAHTAPSCRRRADPREFGWTAVRARGRRQARLPVWRSCCRN
ncbi:unnamed protein product [Prorocentrum cordatum]|nr:unnamed protein product [Polarella glacialis]